MEVEHIDVNFSFFCLCNARSSQALFSLHKSTGILLTPVYLIANIIKYLLWHWPFDKSISNMFKKREWVNLYPSEHMLLDSVDIIHTYCIYLQRNTQTQKHWIWCIERFQHLGHLCSWYHLQTVGNYMAMSVCTGSLMD